MQRSLNRNVSFIHIRHSLFFFVSAQLQTLAADLCSFIAGKKNVPPFHPVNRIEYHNRTHLFLYDANLFRQKKHVSMKGKVVR